MIVVSVKFKGRGKTYFFDPNGLEVPEGVQVIVETSKGMELADCVQGNHEVTDERIVPPLRPVLRIATSDDLRVAELCKEREKDAFEIAEKKIAEHGLDMKLVDVECNFEGSKILFFFTSDGRVDFRELVKDLAGVFRTRIELRQIGVRDEAKMLGGIGICGRPFCCHQFLDDFEPVSTKMAKTQSLSLNPTKISGSCGRLMCCLRYEQEAYEELVKNVPKHGAFVETPMGYGNVAQINLLRQKVKVRLDGEENNLRTFDADEVAAIPGGRPKPGEPLPHVLKLVPKKQAELKEEPEDVWVMPPIFAEDTANLEAENTASEEKKTGGSSGRRRRRGKKPSGQAAQSAEEKKSGQQPKAKQPQEPQPKSTADAGSAEKKPGGSSNHRRHRRGGKSSTGQQAPNPGKATTDGPAKQAQSSGKKQGQAKPKNAQPAKTDGAPKTDEGAKKTGHRNHRNYHRKPKAKPSGGEANKQ